MAPRVSQGATSMPAWIALRLGTIGRAERRSGGASPLDRRISDAGRTQLNRWCSVSGHAPAALRSHGIPIGAWMGESGTDSTGARTHPLAHGGRHGSGTSGANRATTSRAGARDSAVRDLVEGSPRAGLESGSGGAKRGRYRIPLAQRHRPAPRPTRRRDRFAPSSPWPLPSYVALLGVGEGGVLCWQPVRRHGRGALAGEVREPG
jgi:hypothetical protein